MTDVLSRENIFYPAIVSLIGALQLARFTRRVGEARGKYRIPVPKTDGDPNFTRIFRAQQNTLEFYPIFITLLWISSIFLHHAIPSIIGLIYLYARYKYFYGYAEAGERRLPGLGLALNILLVLLVMSILGLAATGYTKYTGRTIDVSFYEDKALEYAKPAFDQINSSFKQTKKTLSPYLETASKKVSDVLQDVKTFTTDLVFTFKKRYFSSNFQEPVKGKQEL
ncbi:microsomal glutathione S-transferase 2-like [Dendronephthya gigantea]|uniref:microsomal glutathione S-transferase 2-like n=1 Tax=Dendronephthya gigantea TaxID=151771 RepID=UPI00106D2825|nr:microsomal glutathione S-transferase 2-like [Dendronephthya gigantea]